MRKIIQDMERQEEKLMNAFMLRDMRRFDEAHKRLAEIYPVIQKDFEGFKIFREA